MLEQIQGFMSEQTSALSDQVQKFRKESAETLREAFVDGAENIKALKAPVRVFARSGVKLTAVSQTAMASLIELQSDVLTSALTQMALRLEHAARADTLVDFVRDQVEMFPASRARVVEDAQRAAHIFKVAGREIRNVAAHTYERVLETTEEQVPEVKVAKRKVKKAVRKTKARVRKAAAAA